ncbi:hypothetical protein MMC30_003853 [Trapelia coarctata]|nr:hypothetical protein [Trapelia coarctata]
MSSTSPPSQPLVTPDNYAPVVNVITWFLLAVNVLWVFARLVTRLILSRSLGRDDAVIVVATTFAVALAVTVTFQTANGLGQHIFDQTPPQLTAFEKSTYAGDLLFVLSLMLSKVSILVFLKSLTPVEAHVRYIYGLGALIVVWSVISLLAAAFQCSLPKVWATLSPQCFNQRAFWTYFGISNIATELLLIILPIFIIAPINASISRKLLIISCFSARIVVIACIVPEVIYRRQAYISEDFTFAVWPAVICSQWVTSMSIVTASVPYLQPFFKSLQSGMIRTDDTRRRDGTTILGNYRSKKSANWSGGGSKTLSNKFLGSGTGQQKQTKTKTLELGSWAQASRPDGNGKTTIDVVGGQMGKSQWETESQTSQSHIIRQTTTWVVDHEDEDQTSTQTLLLPRPHLWGLPSARDLFDSLGLDHEHNIFSLLTSYTSPTMSKMGISHEEHQLDTMEGMTAEERDRINLARLGKKQVLKRNFGFMSMLSFSCTILGTWEGIIVLFATGFTNGGPAGMIYGFIVAWVGTSSIFVTIAELVSLAPTAGGQYHWVFMLAPRSSKKFLSYTTGWLTVLAWQAIVASGALITGLMIQGLIVLNNPDYVYAQWHGTLLAWAVLIVTVFINTVVGSLLPKIEGAFLILHVFGFVSILIVLAYMAPHGSPSDVFGTFINGGGWPTQGVSFMVGLLGVSFAFVGADAAVHMSEEIQNAALNVPRSIMSSITLNGALGFAMLIVTLFAVGDIEAVLMTPTGFPFIEIFFQATKSIPGATAMSCIVITLAICGTVGFVATSSRMIWSFARDRGLPFSPFIGKLEPRSKIPFYAIAITTVIAALLALINIGSYTAFNDVLSLSITGFYSTYFAASALLLWRRCTGGIEEPNPNNFNAPLTGKDQLVWGPWRLPGVWGIMNNAFACGYMLVILVFSLFPPTTPTTLATMNYASLVTGALALFSVFYYYVWGRKIYKGPVIEIEP